MGVKDEEAEAEVRHSSLLYSNFVRFGHSCSPFLYDTANAKKKAREEKEKGGDDYKGDSKFASHLKSSVGTSSFSRNQTLKKQREYPPAFACREELMKII